MKAISPKPRKCAVCPTRFVRARPFETWCSPECGLAVLRKAQDKAALAAKREHRIAKAKVERIGDLKTKAQAAFNAFVRARDAGKPCISCGRPDDGQHQRHASHYKSVGAHPELRFNEDNCHASCSQCNRYDGGGLHAGYLPELLRRIGPERVATLCGPHPPAKWSREELARIRRHYSAEARRLVKLQSATR